MTAGPRVRVSRRLATVVALLLAAAVTLNGCAFDPSSVPLPGTTVSGETYRVRIEFENALNLPARAKVASNGIRVGTLRAVTLVDPTEAHDGYVVADVDIAKSVKLPSATTAELRQATVLGDIYIALITPSNGFDDPIPDGGTITRKQTKPALQIEDTMAGIATFVQGGAIHEMQDIITRMNSVLPADPKETARIFQVVGADVEDVSVHLDQADAFLDGMQATTGVVMEDSTILAELLTEAGVTQATDAMTSLIGLLGLYDGFAAITRSLAWVSPLAAAGNAAAKAFMPLAFTARPLDLQAPSNLNKLVALIREKVIPFADHGPKVNIVGVHIEGSPAVAGLSNEGQVDRIIDTLRMIGAVR
ncbi:MlaD family protein [Antrihabitans sp. YC2-6]|uniref:MlaD family protein n=1 Tax=Antrihabitans sp. YC2-6 TaxID=2799498 RepID=UPI0018F552D7|nr:MlaD family protein [Antrihabitans sp. YC2-6]MBJ8344435.1 MCE family protein [Antrihabitans sp. YC2-6]